MKLSKSKGLLYYELYKSGYVEESGIILDNKFIKKGNTKEELFQYAVKNQLELWDHFINTIQEKSIEGIIVPETVNEDPEFLTDLIDKLDIYQLETTLGFLAHYFDNLLNIPSPGQINKKPAAKGFTIGIGKGKGKQLF